MAGRESYHCKLWIDEGEFHDCWTTTEAALTADLSEDLRDAWEWVRQAAVEIGEQRIYASGSCIMFARDVCYFFEPATEDAEVLCGLPSEQQPHGIDLGLVDGVSHAGVDALVDGGAQTAIDLG